MMPPGAEVKQMHDLAKLEVANPRTVPGLKDDDPPVPVLLLGYAAVPLALDVMLELSKQKKTEPDTSNVSKGPEFKSSPNSGWGMLSRDDLLPTLQLVADIGRAESTIAAIQGQLDTMGVDHKVTSMTAFDDTERGTVLEAMESKCRERCDLSGAAFAVRTFLSKHRDAKAAAEWLENAPHFTREYMIALKKRCYTEMVDFWTQMWKELEGQMEIDLDAWRTACQKCGRPFFDFLLQGIYDSSGKACRFESLLRQTQIARDKSAPFNDIFWFEANAPDFWKTVKLAEVQAVKLCARLLGKVIPTAPSLNVTKAEMLEIVQHAMSTPSKACLVFEIKENQAWTHKYLENLSEICNILKENAENGACASILLDDINETGNHGFWDADSQELRKDFLSALDMSRGVKIDISYMQWLTASSSPIGAQNKELFQAIQESQESSVHEWYGRCERLAVLLRKCMSGNKLVVIEMTLNTSLPHHVFFIQHLLAKHEIDIMNDSTFEFQGGSGYSCAFTAAEWAQVLI
jgi:hypothetical protein